MAREFEKLSADTKKASADLIRAITVIDPGTKKLVAKTEFSEEELTAIGELSLKVACAAWEIGYTTVALLERLKGKEVRV